MAPQTQTAAATLNAGVKLAGVIAGTSLEIRGKLIQYSLGIHWKLTEVSEFASITKFEAVSHSSIELRGRTWLPYSS